MYDNIFMTMNISPRRIASVLAIISIISFGGSVIASGISICPDASSCAASVTLANPGASAAKYYVMPQSTESVPTPAITYPSTSVVGIQLTALYVLIVAIAIFIIMEFYRPHITKRFMGRHRYSR